MSTSDDEIIGSDLANASSFSHERHQGCCLSQVADLCCGLDWMQCKYDRGAQTRTGARFAEDRRALRSKFTKRLDRKRLA